VKAKTFITLVRFLWQHRQELIEVEEAIRMLVLGAKAAKAA
jgi:hypothetical protein